MVSKLRFPALVFFFCVVIVLVWFLLGGFEGPRSEDEPPAALPETGPKAPSNAKEVHPRAPTTQTRTREAAESRSAVEETPSAGKAPRPEAKETVDQPPNPVPRTNSATSGNSTVEGTVTVFGKKPARLFVDIEVTTPSDTVLTVPVVIHDDGSYIAERVPEGSARLLVDATTEDGARRTRMETLEVRPNQRYRQNVDFGETGTIVGRFLGLKEDESGAVLALEGAHEINAQSVDEIHELAAEAEGEKMVRPTTDGSEPSYRLEDLEAGTYTVIGLVDQRFSRDAGENATIWYTSDTVEVKAGQEVSLDIDLE